MNTREFKRKLIAILSADVQGYSRLMGRDERTTIRNLTAYKEAMSNLIRAYHGRVVDAPGDNLLAEFGSVVDAVNCAVEIQQELAERNSDLPPSRQMEFRIGINLGDVVEKRGVFTAMASTSPPGWRDWLKAAVFVSPEPSMIRSSTSSIWSTSFWANRPSRILKDRFGSIGF